MVHGTPHDHERGEKVHRFGGLVEGHQELLKRLDLTFGITVSFLCATAIVAWLIGKGSLVTVITLGLFILSNLALSQVSARSQLPFRIEAGRLFVFGPVASVGVHWVINDSFAPFWIVYFIHGTAGSLMLYVITNKPLWSYLQVFFWGLLFVGVESLRPQHLDILQQLLIFATIVMGGTLITAVSHLLAQSLERESRVKASMTQYAKMSALGEMAGGIAHEINNPLAAIKNLLGQLQEVVDDDPLERPVLKEMAADAEKMTDRIARIVLSLRSFSRDGAKDPFLPVNVRHLLDETLNLCGERLRSRRIKLDIESFPASLGFEGSITQVSQVLLNLLNNACDAIAGSSEPWIRIVVTGSSDAIEIRIIDCGKGISPENRERLFQPFFTTKAIGKGTGLGLSISSGIAQSHGGRLFLDPQYPNTCFVLHLPRTHASPGTPGA
jgi:signal transduction histidine kinase